MSLEYRSFKKAVILGAGGFIGTALAKYLIGEGYEVICFDRQASPYWPNEAHQIIGEFDLMPKSLLDVLKDAFVYHLISSCRPSQDTNNAASELSGDVATTVRYLELTRNSQLRWIFVSSGGTVYGASKIYPIKEDQDTKPLCSYGLVKLTIENYFALYKRLYGVDFVIARLANPYGPGQSPLSGQGLIAVTIYKAINGENIDIWGDGEVVRDYIYLQDSIEGLVLISKGVSGEIYNIGTGEGVSINQLLENIASTLNIKLLLNYQKARSIDVSKNILDNGKLKNSFNWKPKISLTNGIVETSNWIKSTFNNKQ